MENMTRPPHGLCLPVVYKRSRDADTVEVSISGGAIIWAIRLKDINSPEARDPGGPEATEFTHQACSTANTLSVWIPAPRKINILKSLSFDRIVGDLWIENVAERWDDAKNGWLTSLLVSAGHAERV